MIQIIIIIIIIIIIPEDLFAAAAAVNPTTSQRLLSLEHLRQNYLKHTVYFSIWIATYFATVYFFLPTPAVLPKSWLSNSS
jgi:hypothetical protein